MKSWIRSLSTCDLLEIADRLSGNPQDDAIDLCRLIHREIGWRDRRAAEMRMRRDLSGWYLPWYRRIALWIARP